MSSHTTLTNKLFIFLKLFAPMALTQFSLLAGTFVAVFLSGRHGTADLAGVSVGYNIWIAVYMGVMGILLGITPIISHLRGAESERDIPSVIQHGLYLATGLGFFMLSLWYFGLDPLLSLLNLEPEAYRICVGYMKAFTWGIFPILWVCIFRNVVDSHGFTQLSMLIMTGSFFVSAGTTYIFIEGLLGFPELGGIGAGYGTAVACWFNAIMYSGVFLFKEPFAGYRIFSYIRPFSFQPINNQLRLGIPIGISIFCEGSSFSIAGLMMAEFGTEIIAAHQAAMSFTTLFYCFPLSISMAATIVVAYELGARRPKDALTYSYLARGVALAIAALICSYTFTHLETVASLYSKDPAVITLIVSFLSYAVFFTVIDAFGTPLQGILRGYRDMRSITIIAVLSYWGVCFPTAYLFSRHLGYGPYGVWIGLLSCVVTAGLLFTLRVSYVQRKVGRQ